MQRAEIFVVYLIYKTENMTYRIRVSLPNIKGFARVYEAGSRNSLHTLAKQMISDMEFPMDQVVLFKAFDAAGTLVARYATFDLGDGSIENITLEKLAKEGVVELTFFYDTIYKKSVIVTIEGEGATNATIPTLIETKGPNPEAFLNGYVAFEDLPEEKRKRLLNPDDDDFEDDDDEEFDGEDGDEEDEEEEIYDDGSDDE